MILFLLFFSIIAGVLTGIPLPLPGVTIYLSDIAVFCCVMSCIFHYKRIVVLVKSDQISHVMGIFLVVLCFSLLITPISLSLVERLISCMYLMRYAMYFSIYLYIRLQKDQRTIQIYLLGSLAIVALIGWIQYFLYPDLRNLYYLGWDPHDRRIFSTYFDPNYLGLLFVFGLILTYYSKLKNNYKIVLEVLLFITLAFTYSRSSYLACIVAVIAISLIAKKYAPVMAVAVFLPLALLLLPHPQGESANLLRLFTIEGRLNNLNQATQLIASHPIFGIGFNTLRYAKHEAGISPSDWETNHAAAGFDNSFLFITATAGLVGLIVFGWVLWILSQEMVAEGKIMLLVTIIHSFIVNSLFFPWVLVCLWIVAGIRKNN
jgi:hypothetical protein